jgi:hypothetical protein
MVKKPNLPCKANMYRAAWSWAFPSSSSMVQINSIQLIQE